jgi:hypothetical protein
MIYEKRIEINVSEEDKSLVRQERRILHVEIKKNFRESLHNKKKSIKMKSSETQNRTHREKNP